MGARLALAVIAGLAVGGSARPAGLPKEVTFYRDIQPVLQQRCQVCHRPGEVAPFSMMTYKEVRPWAKAIREAVLTRKMPPWFAEAAPGTFSNGGGLAQRDIDALVAW